MPGKRHAANEGMGGLWRTLEELPRSRWPTFVRGTRAYGNEKIMFEGLGPTARSDPPRPQSPVPINNPCRDRDKDYQKSGDASISAGQRESAALALAALPATP